MRQKNICAAIIFTQLFFSGLLLAQQDCRVKLTCPFGDHMVLQQQMSVPIWGTAGAGEQVTVKLDQQKQTVTSDSGGRWMVRLNDLKAGGPFEMIVEGENTLTVRDVYVGEVWLCSGQSNMDMTVAREDRYWCGVFNEEQEVASADFPLIRVFDVDFVTSDEPLDKIQGKWEVCSPDTVGHFSATAYFFARELQKKLNVPIGLITAAYGASTAEAWTNRPALESDAQLSFLLDEYAKRIEKYLPDIEAQKKYEEAFKKWEIAAEKARAEGKDRPKEPKNPDPRKDQHSPCVLYNGMVASLVPYAIRGVIWYQGESNGPTARIYGRIMETMIRDWRRAWGQGDFPFLYVQLANHGKLVNQPVRDDPIVFVREGQLQNLSMPNTAMVVAIDNADPDKPDNIHPKNKQDIGLRLSLAARALAYQEDIIYSGPIYDYMIINGNVIRLYFKHVYGGLAAKDDKLVGFAIAGEDKIFVWADAKFDGNTVVVASLQVDKPIAVRYGWARNPVISLCNKAGLPASPFRTDVDSGGSVKP